MFCPACHVLSSRACAFQPACSGQSDLHFSVWLVLYPARMFFSAWPELVVSSSLTFSVSLLLNVQTAFKCPAWQLLPDWLDYLLSSLLVLCTFHLSLYCPACLVLSSIACTYSHPCTVYSTFRLRVVRTHYSLGGAVRLAVPTQPDLYCISYR